ncbi:MAG: sulfite oxidase-like oxidoreductase [Candidatus Eremiobacteraeota bacterium]|nr:sulfite oxidase-like oxidoreductase [Candidatus Eremiobacteraeota bacterium]MBC5827639.1 sulfite oxidase-like oxidoreductase [Candidatus Eremiobacteraeota bacterium]
MANRRAADSENSRLPPGQYAARDFPVLHVGSVPRFDPKTWRLNIFGKVRRPRQFYWEQFCALPSKTVVTDIHCVTRWTKFDSTWEGVPFREVMRLVEPQPEAKFVLTYGANSYAANVPLTVADDEDVLLAYKYEGQPLEPIHGGPMRILIPKRYFWKSTKWCTGVEFASEDVPGFWEVRGYHNDGDPWQEERYW